MVDEDPTESQHLYPRRGEVLDDKYEIQEVLGVGGMGAVIRAQHLLRKVPVALKFMSPRIMGQRDIIERFLNEGVASSKIDSDHVVKVFDVCKLPSGVPYMVMEFLQGEDVAALMKREGIPYLPEIPRAVHITVQILRGLQAAHRVKIIHRDLKPANCFLVGKDGDRDFVKLVDFGISKIRNDEGGLELTSAGAALGTPLYMSLEQARSPKDVDARSDLYSVAVILYELLCGCTPFVPMSGTLSELFTMLALEEPKPLEERRPEIPPGLAAIVHKGLQKHPNNRFQNAEEMAEALAAYSDERTDYIVSRMLRTTGASLRSQRPPPSRSVPATRLSGTVMMDSSSAPPTIPNTLGTGAGATGAGVAITGPGMRPITNPTLKDTAPADIIGTTAQGTVRDAGRTHSEERQRSTPLVYAIAVVAVGAVAAAAWALGKVTSSTPDANASKPTAVEQTAAPAPPPSQAKSTEAPSAEPSGEPKASSSAITSATVGPRVTGAPPNTLQPTAPPPPSPSVNTHPKRLPDIGRD